MKLSPHAHQKLWDVHTWAGILGGLVLFVMFLTGGVTLFHEYIAVWEHPQAQVPAPRISLQESFDRALRVFDEQSPQSAPFADDVKKQPAGIVFTPAGEKFGNPMIGYANPDHNEWIEIFVDVENDRLVRKQEQLAHLLYYIHLLWNDAAPWLYYYLAGALCIAMVLSLFTGLLIHLRNITREFHQFRPTKKPRVVWTDMHKVLGVMGFPFQLIFAFSGAFIILAPLFLQTFSGPVFGGDPALANESYYGVPPRNWADKGPKVDVLSLDELQRRVLEAHPNFETAEISVLHNGHANATVEFRGEIEGVVFGDATIRLSQADGEIIAKQIPGADGAASALHRWMVGLHVAGFGGLGLRLILFFLSLATCATIVTGSWIWLARRRRKKDTLGYKLLARLTCGVGAGSFVAVAALILASRVLPRDMHSWSRIIGMRGRIGAEGLVFVGALVICIGWALLARSERATWWRQLALAGLLLLPIPLAAASWSTAGLFGAGDALPVVMGVDIGILVCGALLCVVAWRLRRRFST
jgi:uncharacterized iron-regulated membrane protein